VLDPGRVEDVDGPAGERPGLGLAAVVHAQGAAAALVARDDDVATLHREHAGGGRVDAREELSLHAAGEHPHDRPPLAARGHPLGQSRRRPYGRGQRLHRGQRGRDAVQHSAALYQPLQAAAAVGRQGTAQSPQAARVREQREDPRAQQPVPQRATVPPLDLRTGRLDEPVVLHPGRAGRDAGHAAEAGVEVAHHGVGERLAVEARLHEVDPTARAVHLLAPERVGRAGRQAEAAVHAVRGELGGRRPVGVERRPARRRAHQLGAGAAARPVGGVGRAHVRSLRRNGRGRAGDAGRARP
jgi:hypothetical protein